MRFNLIRREDQNGEPLTSFNFSSLSKNPRSTGTDDPIRSGLAAKCLNELSMVGSMLDGEENECSICSRDSGLRQCSASRLFDRLLRFRIRRMSDASLNHDTGTIGEL